MSEIFDLTNDLFDVISESMMENNHDDTRHGGEDGEDDDDDDGGNRDSISQITNNMDANTSIDLLEECASALLQDMDVNTSWTVEEDEDESREDKEETPRINRRSIPPQSQSQSIPNDTYSNDGDEVRGVHLAVEDSARIHTHTKNAHSSHSRTSMCQEKTPEKKDIFMQAAIKRRKRQRDANNKKTNHNGSLVLITPAGERSKRENTSDVLRVLEESKEVNAAEAEALACLESFRVDVDAFRVEWDRTNDDDETTTAPTLCTRTTTNLTKYKHAIKFAQHLDSKYTSVIERLSSRTFIGACTGTGTGTGTGVEYDAKIAKIKKLVYSFCRRCRAIELHDLEGARTSKAIDEITRLCNIIGTSSRGRATKKEKSKVLCRFKYWTCKVCGKQDLEFDQLKCSCCGRPKTYRPPPQNEDEITNLPTFQDPIIEGEGFLAGANVAKEKIRKQAKMVKLIKEERIMKQFLYRKVDLELDLRAELKDEVRILLDSIQSTKRRLQLYESHEIKEDAL